MSKARDKQLAKEIAKLKQRFGHRGAALGSERMPLDVIPTGSLALDYALGTGGWPRAHPIEVYGPDDIGKSSVIGFNAMKGAIAQGMVCGVVAVEPGWDAAWAEENGVDTSQVLIVRPDSGEEAFSQLTEWAMGDLVDFILFDSLGALLRDTENIVVADKGEKKKDVTPGVGGASALMTWGAKNCLMPTFKNNKCVMFLNQVREDLKSKRMGTLKPYGARAMYHIAAVRVSLRLASGGFINEKVEGEEMMVGRKLVAVIERNKLSKGSNRRAEFDYYMADVNGHDLGIDAGPDVINTAIRTRVIQGTGYYEHSTWPKKLHGKDAVTEYLEEHPESAEKIREEVLGVMLERQGPVQEYDPKEIEVDDKANLAEVAR